MGVVRQAIAIALSLALQAAGLSAPFVHAHPDDHDTDHHAGSTVHAHWAGHAESHHSSDAKTVSSGEHDRAVSVHGFVAVTAASFGGSAVTHTAVELPAPAERPAHRRVEITHSHDPPPLLSRSPRAPPLSLS